MSVRDRIRDVYNRAFDRYLGVQTADTPENRRRIASSLLGDDHNYVPMDYVALWYLLAPVRLASSDVFVDIGCGLGRVVLVAARKPIRAAIGIEFNERLARQAAENAQKLRGRRAPVSMRHEDAAEADYDDCTVFWFYNPFGPTTMVRVLDRIRASHEAHPRRVRIIYALPKQADLFDAQSWLRRVGERRFPGAVENAHAIYWEAHG